MSIDAPRLFPFALYDGVEGLHARHGRTGYTVYRTVLLALLLGAAALPLIHVDVTTRSRGVLRPDRKLTPVAVPVGGRILEARLAENAAVCAGDTLLIVAADALGSEAAHLRRERADRDRLLADLRTLLDPTANATYPSLRTAVYQRDYREYRRRRDEARLRLAHADRHRERQEELLTTGSVARMDAEQATYEADLLRGQLAQLTDQQQRAWTQDRQRLRRERADLDRQLEQLRARAKEYVVTAPVDGELTQTGGLQAGAFATPGQLLAQVSPAGPLRVEAFVSPADVGLLREGMDVQLQLDAFDHQQWGLAAATLTEIGTDVTELDGAAAFRVLCTLHDRALYLSNGYRGTLRKGMTLTAHFTLTRRTLYQLLRDRVDDWLNPTYY
ncbi:HlyD family secretion protein [Lewinella sp. IMCC34183]|uniref:HlyD family secretion protein n=1 Tax=Lewinella sp. IMCC34183 TaxID=2248762 RepID=UPI000E2316AC|nr:HlyD family efflux transporter periplasmic adaptor subunit [Lewinella sp. IMCC34183]